jgi:hypothetical protein
MPRRYRTAIIKTGAVTKRRGEDSYCGGTGFETWRRYCLRYLSVVTLRLLESSGWCLLIGHGNLLPKYCMLLRTRIQSFLFGPGLTLRLCIIYVWFKNYVFKIMSKSPTRHLVRLQGKLRRIEKEKIHIFLSFLYFPLLWRNSPNRAQAASFRRLHDHTQTHHSR